MLLLSITVVLFSTIFFALRYFPKPSTQPTETFAATAGLTGVNITSISITYVEGPALGPATRIYATSLAQPSDIRPPGGLTYFTIGTGLGGSTAWHADQTWSIVLASYVSTPLTLPDNVTISVVSGGALLLKTGVPGATPIVPPMFTGYSTSPTVPSVGGAFAFKAAIQDANAIRWANITLKDIPGYSSSTGVAMTSNGSGVWIYSVPAGTTSSAQSGATYYAIVTATDSLFQTSQVVIPVVFH